MEAKIIYDVKSSGTLPEQLEVVDGKLVMLGTTETPTFPDISKTIVSLVPREDLVRLMDIKDKYKQLRLLLREVSNEIEGAQDD